MCSDRSRCVQHSSKRCINAFASRECFGHIGFKHNNVGLTPKSLHVLASNPAGHGSEVVFGAHVVFKMTDLFHRIVFLVMLPFAR